MLHTPSIRPVTLYLLLVVASVGVVQACGTRLRERGACDAEHERAAAAAANLAPGRYVEAVGAGRWRRRGRHSGPHGNRVLCAATRRSSGRSAMARAATAAFESCDTASGGGAGDLKCIITLKHAKVRAVFCRLADGRCGSKPEVARVVAASHVPRRHVATVVLGPRAGRRYFTLALLRRAQ